MRAMAPLPFLCAGGPRSITHRGRIAATTPQHRGHRWRKPRGRSRSFRMCARGGGLYRAGSPRFIQALSRTHAFHIYRCIFHRHHRATLWPPYGHQGRTRDAPGIMQWCTLGRSNAAPNDACIRKHLFFFRVISPGILPFLVYRSFFFVLYRNYFLTYAGMHRYIQIIETTADTHRRPRHQGAAVGKQRSAPASKPTTAETPGRETDQLPERGSRLQPLE